MSFLNLVETLPDDHLVALLSNREGISKMGRPLVDSMAASMLDQVKEECREAGGATGRDVECGAKTESYSDKFPGKPAVEFIAAGVICTRACIGCPLGLSKSL